MHAAATTIRLTAAAACLTLFGVLVAGCGHDTARRSAQSPPRLSASSTPSSSPSSSPSRSPVDAAREDALTAYRNMWAAFVRASHTSNPDAPALRRYARRQALHLIVSGLYTARDQDLVGKGTVRMRPRVTGVQPPQAPRRVSVTDCVDDSKWLTYHKNGGLLDAQPGGRHRTTAVVINTTTGWKVDSFVLKDTHTC